MRTIWKYTIPVDGNSHEMLMPVSAKYLTCGVQGKNFVFWMLVEGTEVTTSDDKRTYRVFMTGEEIPSNFNKYLGTAHVKVDNPISPNIVMHLFEEDPYEP